MGLTLVTPASDPLVSVADAKLWCKVDETIGTTEDNWFASKIASVAQQIEAFTGRTLGAQTWRLTLDAFADSIELPVGPVQSITSIVYDDAEGDEQTLDAAYYTLDLASNPQWVVRNADYSWPELLDAVNTVRITFVAGYGASSPVLADMKDVCLDTIGYWYRNRGDISFPREAKDRLRPYRLPVL